MRMHRMRRQPARGEGLGGCDDKGVGRRLDTAFQRMEEATG